MRHWRLRATSLMDDIKTSCQLQKKRLQDIRVKRTTNNYPQTINHTTIPSYRKLRAHSLYIHLPSHPHIQLHQSINLSRALKPINTHPRDNRKNPRTPKSLQLMNEREEDPPVCLPTIINNLSSEVLRERCSIPLKSVFCTQALR